VIVDNDGRRWTLDATREVVGANRLEEGHVEHGVDSHRHRKLETERCLADLVCDWERAETLVVELVAGSSSLDVTSEEPYLIADLERGSFLDLAVVETGLGRRGFD
jgi:hypothetical protein